MTLTYGRRVLAGLAFTAAAAIAGATFAGTSAIAAPTSGAEGSILGAGAPDAIEGQYIVVFKDGTSASSAVNVAASQFASRVGAKVRQSYTNSVRGFSAKMTEAAAKRLAADPAVSFVEQDRLVSIAGTQTNPPSWGLDRIDQQSLPLSGSYTYGGASNVTAYILDTGVRLTHNDFGGRATSGYDFIDNDANASDCQGHGTHVAGTVGGATYGVAKDVKLVAVRVLDCNGSGSYSQIIAGVDWVTKNAVKPAVANMSLGGSASSALDNAVKNSIASGVVYGIAAGNDSTNACNTSPARLAEAITVGATASSDARASFSNYGSCLDIFAPGESILSSANSSNTGTTRMSGTSMATPHVVGAAALVLGATPAATATQVRDAMVNGATAGKVTNAGTGSPNRLLYTGAAGTTPTPTPEPNPTPAPADCAPVANGYDRAIADLGTVDSKITINCAGNASSTAKVEVHVKHTDRGDLAIWLIAPDGTQYKLKSSTSGDNYANLDKVYTADLSSEARTGTWTLRVKDVFAGDKGTLDSWTLSL